MQDIQVDPFTIDRRQQSVWLWGINLIAHKETSRIDPAKSDYMTSNFPIPYEQKTEEVSPLIDGCILYLSGPLDK